MEWTDEGIVLGVRRHGEANAILDLLTREHGRHLGMVRGGAGSRQRPVLQPGNTVRAVWRARLDDHLGNYTVEGLRLRTGALLAVSSAVYGVTHLSALARLLPERDPHPLVHAALEAILDRIDDVRGIAPMVVRFELQLLAELGFGLDLDRCAATGVAEDLAYVSPKSGRAVSRSAGAPWHDRLLPLPAFFLTDDGEPSAADVAAGFAVTGLFLARYVIEPRGLALSDARQHFIAAAVRHWPADVSA
jgi:DNA repair protein RecO (recombination protein O)